MSEAGSNERGASNPSDPSSPWNSTTRAGRLRRRRLLALAGVAAALVLLATVVFLSMRNDGRSAQDGEPNPTSEDKPTLGLVQEDGGLLVSSSDYGAAWPLTVDSVVLRCDGEAVTLEAEEKLYALNAEAQNKGLGIALKPIWTENPDVEGARMNIGVLIEQGLRVCR